MFSGNTSRAVVSKLASVAALAIGMLGFVAIAPANATATPGRYIATGHDLDYHCADGDNDSCEMLQIFVDKAANYATPDVLALTSADGTDSCLTQSLDTIGVTHHDINITTDAGAAEWAAANLSDYNVIIQGSIWGSGQCDEPADDTFITRVNARSADVIAFYNAGGGVIQQSNGGGEQGSDAWDLNYFMPVGFHAASVEQSDPRTITAEGVTWDLTDAMSNCCATHNAFIALPAEFKILEVDVNNLPISIVYEGITMGASGIGGNDLDINMELDLDPGETVEGAPVTVSGAWLKADSEWNTVLRSTPQTVCSSDDLGNTNIYGAFLCTFELPAGLEPGTHTITLTGIAPDGSTLTRVAYLVIDGAGKLVSWSYSDNLAETGIGANEVPAVALLGGGLALAGAVAVVVRRRAIAKR